VDLSTRTLQAVIWLYGLRFVTRGISLARNIVLARLLTPGDFGLLGIAVLTAGFLEVFTRSGLEHSVIQRSQVSRHELNALWTFDALRGVLLSALMFLVAPAIGAVLGSPESVPVIRVMSIIPATWFLRHIDFIIFQKELEFRKIFYIEAAAETLNVIVGISLAFAYRNVWALVISMIAGRVAIVIGSYVVSTARPRLVWDWAVVKDHFNYGRQILVTGISQYTYNNGDDWFVGRVLGVSALGLYRWAYTLGNLVTTELTLVLARVLFPAFSKLKDDTTRLRNGFVRTQKALILVVAPTTVFLVFFAEPFIGVVLGDKWLPMVPAFQVLAVWGGMRAPREVCGDVFRAVGRPAVVAYITFVKLMLMAVLLWPARQYGIAGIASIVLITSALEFPVLMWLTARYLKMRTVSFYYPLLLPVIVAIGGGGVSFLLSMGSPDWVRLLLGLGGTFGGYLFVMIAIEYWFAAGYFTEVRRAWGMVRSRNG
jgi:O-antigen/teichoic acid export membrane protein